MLSRSRRGTITDEWFPKMNVANGREWRLNASRSMSCRQLGPRRFFGGRGPFSVDCATQDAFLAPPQDMKHSLLAVALLAAAASPASADKFALDYRATDPSCIDAGRFADEVSAKLGFVPWDPSA